MSRDARFSLSRRRFLALATGAGALLPAREGAAEEESLAACLPPERWERVERKVDRLLSIFGETQRRDGALETAGEAQPATTSVAVMAFLSRGHAPGRGPYGACLERALEYVLSTQDETGVFSTDGLSQEATYHHAFTGFMLGEVYGLTGNHQTPRVREAIVKALAVSRRAQRASSDGAGMRYFTNPRQADLSVTGGHFLFYRSAKSAEFDVPEEWINQMALYVRECARPDGRFVYGPEERATLATTAIGLLFLNMTGRRDHALAAAAAQRVLTYHYNRYMQWRDYSLYYASLAMSQTGGEPWRAFFPRLVDAQMTLPEGDNGLLNTGDSSVGPVLSNAFLILSLTPPCQVLPIFQR